MSTNPVTGTWLIRRMRAAFSSRSGLGTRRLGLIRMYYGPTLRERMASQTASRTLPVPPLRSRCVVHTSSGSVGTHGGTTGPPHHDSAARRDALLVEVSAERDRQDATWGGTPGVDRRDDHTYAAVLGEEFGECCKAWLQRNVAALREELIQTAAVAVAWVEELDNGGARQRSNVLWGEWGWTE